jgi:hypothetical protein
VPSLALSLCFPLLFLSLGLFFPPLQLFQPFCLFPSSCWSPFGFFDDFTECTSADWVGLEDPDEASPPADFVVKSADFTLVDPTMPSAWGPGPCLGS